MITEKLDNSKGEYIPKIINILNTFKTVCLNEYSKIFIMRFDLRFPEQFGNSNDEAFLSLFIHNLIQKIDRDEKIFVKYIWVREQKESNHQHYHFLLYLDGHKVQLPHSILRYAEHYWKKIMYKYIGPWNYNPYGLVQYGDYMMIYRKGIPDFNKYIRMTSYLAKTDTKGPIGDGHRNFGHSQL